MDRIRPAPTSTPEATLVLVQQDTRDQPSAPRTSADHAVRAGCEVVVASSLRAGFLAARGRLVAVAFAGVDPAVPWRLVDRIRSGDPIAIDRAAAAWAAPRELAFEVIAAATPGGPPSVDLALRLARGLRDRRPAPCGLLHRHERITADDWGLSAAVNDGILDLARRGVVRRVSMLATGAHLERGLGPLLAIPGVTTGLHFDLTRAGRSPARWLAAWLVPSRRRRLIGDVRRTLSSQLARLVDAGVPVQYLDGHHHIQILPGLLDAVADLLAAAGIGQVRIPYDPALWTTGRQLPINVLARLAGRSARRLGLAFTPFVYPPAAAFTDHARLRRLLAMHLDCEVLVHPADDSSGALPADDAYTTGRVMEYEALRMLACEWEFAAAGGLGAILEPSDS